MVVWETLVVAFSMFSALPMPNVEWTRENMRWSLLAFPLVGAVIGGVCRLWVLLCSVLMLPALMRGAGLCVLPILLTGGIHLDGYADTCDALASHADPARKREILKDPHLGAFAAIRLGVYFVVSLAAWTGTTPDRGWAIVCMFCLSRALSGLALTWFPLAEGSGLARTFAEASDQRRVRTVLAAAAVLLSVAMAAAGGAVMLLPAAVVFLRFYRMARKDFPGLSGDLCGWFVQTTELWMVLTLCFAQHLGRVLL